MKRAMMIAAVLGVSWNSLAEAIPPPDWWYLQVCTEKWTNTVTGEEVTHVYQNNGTSISGNDPRTGIPVWQWGDWKQTLIVCALPPIDGGGIAKPVTGVDLVVSTGTTGLPGSIGPTITSIDLTAAGVLFFSGNNAGQFVNLSDPNFGLASTSAASGWLTLDPSLEKIPLAIIELDYSGLAQFTEYTVSVESSVLYDQFGLPYQDLGIGDYTITTVPEPSSMLLAGMGLLGVGAFAYRRRRDRS